MASTRESNPLADVVAITAGPAFVMLMVGSLVYFLVEVLYGGNYSGRLLWTMFFFVFGCVLIARISIELGRSRASLYAAGLGGACFLAMMSYVEYPPGPMRSVGPVVNLVLMALVWWASDRLTWDCTHLDENRKASGRGVLAAAGLDETTRADGKPVDAEEESAEPKKPKKYPPGFVGWLERWRDFRTAQNKKPHTPGVTVLYFALAALPLFALGQSLIDPADAARRRATFVYMALYIGSALALLVTTSLFGLKKYLEERNARVPAVMTFGWLGLGGALIVAFLAIGALLPPPHSETAWFGLSRAGSKDRDASDYAVIRDGDAGKGDGAKGQKTEAGDGKSSGKNGKQGGNSGEKGDGGGDGKDGQGGKQQGEKGSSQGEQGGNKSGQGKDAKSSNKKGDGQKKQSNKDESSGESSSGQNSDDPPESQDDERGSDADEGDSGSRSDSGSSAMSKLSEALAAVSGFIKWLVWILVALAVIAGVVYFILKGLAPFTNWAKNLLDWLRGLFARKAAAATAPGQEEAAETGPSRPPPFSSFANPFRTGAAEDEEPAELAAYTFAALDAWAWDRDMGREPGETPLEFATRVGHHFEKLDEPAYRVATLFVQAQYSRAPLPKSTLAALETLWDHMEESPPRKAARRAFVVED